MKKLHLEFVDPDGAEQSAVVESGKFLIGRHSGCDLVIPDSRLSREHVRIDSFGEVFTISDLKSSNGTEVDGEELDGCIALEELEGEILLGGGVRISYFIETDAEEEASEETEQVPAAASASAAAPEGSGFGLALILVPVLGLFLLLGAGIGAFYLFSGNSTERTGNGRDNGGYSDGTGPDDTFDESRVDEPSLTPSQIPTTETVQPNGSMTPPDIPLTPVPTAGGPDNPNGNVDREIEGLVYSFMRKIAKNDRRPYIKTQSFQEVVSRTNRYKGSSALAANIRNASSNAARIRSLALEKNLQPQFLAAAAITKMGGGTGDVAAKAAEIVGVLDRLTIVIGNELADDALLVIAAYDEGKAGNNLQMRDRLARLTKKNPTASPREIRTIWFLREQGEITASQYEFALNFLAVGTIAQNPKKFNVNSESLKIE